MGKKPHWTIYCHTHVASGRRYVGLTKMTMMKRWNRHVYSANRAKKDGRSHFANAIRKYGKDAFDHEVLEVCDTLEASNAAEERWIAHFDTTDPAKGFNLAKGGGHTPHSIKNPWDRPEYRRKSLAAAKRRWEDPQFRARVTSGVTEAWKDPEYRRRMIATSKEVNSRPEVKAAISAAASSRSGQSSRFRGVCWNKELGKWRAYVWRAGKMTNVGHFADEEEAALAHDRTALELYGDAAPLNFRAAPR